MLRMLAVKRMF